MKNEFFVGKINCITVSKANGILRFNSFAVYVSFVFGALIYHGADALLIHNARVKSADIAVIPYNIVA